MGHKRHHLARHRWRALLFGLVLVLLATLPAGAANAPPDRRAVADAEARHLIDQGFTFPSYAVLTPEWGQGTFMVVLSEPVRYVVVLAPAGLPDYATHNAAHELMHILFAEAGLTQDEEVVEDATWCFGSAGARRASERWLNRPRSGTDCGALRQQIQQRQPT